MTEKVLVVESRLILERYGSDSSRLIAADEAEFTALVNANYDFAPRNVTETDPSKKQIIPYCVVTHEDCIFMTQRTKKQTEKRLHNMCSVGLGGHINPPDSEADNVLLEGMRRELAEEIHIPAGYTHRFLGLINDNSTDVNAVHTGACYLIEAPSPDCYIKETEKMTGRWVKRADIRAYFDAMEGWSQIALASILNV